MVKKRTIVGLFLCVALLMFGAGCSKSKTTSSSSGENPGVQSTESQNPGAGSSANTQAGSDAKQTATDKTGASDATQNDGSRIMGKVKSISGSNITLALIKMPEKSANPPQSPPTAQDGQNAQPAPNNAAAPELSGETKTITIPSGAKIISGNKDSSKTISISDIKTGDMLEVQLKDGAVQEVRVMQTPQ